MPQVGKASIYQRFFDVSLDMLCVAGPDGYFKELNPRWSEVLGYTQGELKSQPFINFVHPDDREKTLKEAALLGEGDHVTVSFQNRYRKKDGSYIWLLWSSGVSDGELIAVARDITPIKEKEELFENLQTAAHVGAWSLDVETMETTWTTQTYRIHEVEIGTPTNTEKGIEFYAPEAQPIIADAVKECIQHQKPWDLELRFFTAKGKETWIRTIGYASRVVDGNVRMVAGTFQDISDEKKSRDRLELALQASHIGIWELDLESKTFKWDANTRKLFKVSDFFEPTYDAWMGFLPDYEKERVDSIFQSLFQGKEKYDFTCTIVFPDKTEREIRVVGDVQKDKKGNPVLVKGLNWDLTDQVEENRKLESIVFTSELGYWEWNIVSKEIRFDKRWCEIVGRSVEEVPLSPDTFYEYLHPEDREVVDRHFNSYLEGSIPSYEVKFRLQHKEGHWVPILGKGKVTKRDQDGQPIVFSGTHLDLTNIERKERHLEEARLEAEKQNKLLAQIVRDSGVSIITVNHEGIVQSWNKKAEEIFEFKAEEIIGKSIKKITPLDKVNETGIILESVFSGKSMTLETTRVSQSGERIPIELHLAPLRHGDGSVKGVSAHIVDIRKKKEMEKQLFHSSKLATIGELAAGIGHEINNPLAILSGNVERIRKRINEEEDPDLERYFESCRIATGRIMNIVNGLRKFSRNDGDHFVLFDLCKAVQETKVLVSDLFKNDNVDLEVNLPETPLYIKGNEGRVQQAVMNILSNAKDALGSGKGMIKVSMDADNESVHLSIRDNGIGIPEEVQNKIFDGFFTTKKVGQGTGIGLSLTATIVKEHGGNIRFQSKQGIGTEFFLEFPRSYKVDEHKASDNVLSFFSKSFSGSILLVDDEEELRSIVADILESVGIEVVQASNGKEALEMLKNKRFDVLLTDMKMPEMDGPALIYEVRKIPEYIGMKILAITGGIEEDIHADLRKAVDGFLYKPFDEEKILSLIDRVQGVDQKRAA